MTVNTANTSYTFGMATGEVILLLLLSFLVGMMLCWLLRAIGLCCRRPRRQTLPTYTAPAPLTTPASADEVELSPVRTASLHSPTLMVEDIEPHEVEWLEASAMITASVDQPPVPAPAPPPVVELDPLLFNINPFKPIVDPPDATDLPEQVVEVEPEPLWPEIDPLLASIDPHKPIIDPPDMDTEMEVPAMHTETTPQPAALDPLLANIDPHKPIVDAPDADWATASLDPLLASIDPHKPIVEPPDMAAEPAPADSAAPQTLHDWLHKAKESVEHLTEKATPTTQEWLHKAKEKVEHLSEKATPHTSEWLHKARESVEHLSEKATPATSEWLHKAKELGNDLGSKSSHLGSDALTKGSSTLAALAASAKELTEKLANSLSIHQDDLQKLKGVGPTFASILHRAGIHTYQQLAEASPLKLRSLLIVEDEQFSQHDTSSWPQQAALAAQGDWEQLKAYQDTLPNT